MLLAYDYGCDEGTIYIYDNQRLCKECLLESVELLEVEDYIDPDYLKISILEELSPLLFLLGVNLLLFAQICYY